MQITVFRKLLIIKMLLYPQFTWTWNHQKFTVKIWNYYILTHFIFPNVSYKLNLINTKELPQHYQTWRWTYVLLDPDTWLTITILDDWLTHNLSLISWHPRKIQPMRAHVRGGEAAERNISWEASRNVARRDALMTMESPRSWQLQC